MLIEYKVRPVTRYVITRFETSGPDANGRGSGGCETKGEYETEAVAHEVAYALCRQEHDRLGFPPGDERIQYPKRPEVDPQLPINWAATLETSPIAGPFGVRKNDDRHEPSSQAHRHQGHG
jgi:hypothetical protein